MTPAQWEKVKDLVAGALELPPAGRAAFLDRECSEEPEIRHEVESLLAADTSATFLRMDTPQGAAPPTRAGVYRIEREVGRGGMGAVYLARRDDGQFEQDVAIKVIKRGMDTDAVLQRFLAERRILARLQHRNIVRLFDGGMTENGQPYFVMEYLEGKPIDEYCRECALPIEARLALFLEVCSAVEHAHKSLVLHRDIKASNVLVGPDGIPKLLDFGIAKVLEDDSLDHTATALRPLTVSWASPEQVRGEPLTTATDVYSLGLLAYLIVTGQTAYDLAQLTPADAAATVCDRMPPRPSETAPRATQRRLKGDLDTIVLKALQKEPARRYVSVAEFAEDIRRSQRGLPIVARPDSFGYRSTRFLQRHRTAVAVATLFVVGVGAAAISAIRSARLADRRFSELRGLAHSVIFEIHDSIEKLPGSTAARALVVSRALQYLDGLAKDASSDRPLQRELAEAYDRLGTIQGDRSTSHTGDSAGAASSLRKSAGLYEALVKSDARDLSLRRGLAHVYTQLTLVDAGRGRMDEGLRDAQRSLDLRKSVADTGNLPDDRRDVSVGFMDLAYARTERGELREALEAARQGTAILEAAAAAHPEDQSAQRALANGLKRLGQVQGRLRMFREFAGTFQRAQQIDERLLAANPTDRAAMTSLAIDYENSSRMFRFRGDLKRGEESLRRALALDEQVASSDPADDRPRNSMMLASLLLVENLLAQERAADALPYARRALALGEERHRANPSERTNGDLASCLVALGNVDSALSSPEKSQARALYERAREILIGMKTRNTLSTDDRKELAALEKKLSAP